MSIINALREHLTGYEGLELVLTDLTRGPGSYAVARSGNGSIKRDIFGGKTYQNNYVFLAKEHGGDEVDRRDNYDFLESFCDWLEEQSDEGNLPKLPEPYTPVSLDVSNVMLMGVEDGGDVTYQVQIQFVYRKNNEVKNKWLM